MDWRNSPSPLRARIWLFRALAVLAPVAALVILETGLRLAGYGYSTGFFRPLRIGSQPFLVENDAFGYQFFPRDLARMPLSLRVPAKKPGGTYRIFILGESAAMGDPEPAFGAGRYLAVLLRERFPQAKFEVINTAMTAVNSHAILPIARDCARRQGDFWILYIGNNEMVGPFGAATVFGWKAPPVPLVRWFLACQRLRTGQLVLALGRKLLGASASKSWGGMDMFLGQQLAPDAPARSTVYRNFQKNLEDIVRAGLDSGANVLLSTVAVNLKDCPPFASQHSTSINSEGRAAADSAYQEACQVEQRGNVGEAALLFERAALLDPGPAEVHYRWGQVMMRTTNFAAAREQFQRACDNDALPFRATSPINEVIRQVGREFAGTRFDCVDAIPSLQGNRSEGLGGAEIFYEHVHFNFAGNYRLARAWAGEVEKFLPASLRRGATGGWASQESCERRLGLTAWDRYQVIKDLLERRQRPPLSAQANNQNLMQQLSDTGAELKSVMETTAARSQARATYADALRLAPEDYFIRENFAEFLEAIGELKAATEQWQQVRELIPQDHAPLYRLGRLAAAQGDLTEAQALLEKAVAMRPSFAPGWFELGTVHAATTNYHRAIVAFDRALVFEPNNEKYWFYCGLALAMAGRRVEAIAHYRQAAQLDPQDWKPHYELGGLLGQDGNYREAKAESEVAVRLNPLFPTAHLNLALALVQIGQLEPAERELNETLRLDPGSARAADYLAQVRVLQKNRAK